MTLNEEARIMIIGVSIAISVTLVLLSLVFWLWSWGAGAIERAIEIERIRTETCYVEYEYSPYHDRHYVSKDYCPTDQGVEQ